MQKLTKEQIENFVKLSIFDKIKREGLSFDRHSELLSLDFMTDIGLSSLDTVELIMETESYFDINFSDREILKIKNGNLLINKIQEKL